MKINDITNLDKGEENNTFDLFKINETISNLKIFYTISNFFFKSIFFNPIPSETFILKNKESLNEYDYFYYMDQTKVRYLTLFKYYENTGYFFLRFLECSYFLFSSEKNENNKDILKLDDSIYSNFLKEIEDMSNSSSQEDREINLNKFCEISNYIVNLEDKEIIEMEMKNNDLYLNSETFRDMFKTQDVIKIWGSFYWSFLHRYVYLLENKILLLQNDEKEKKDRIIICFMIFKWFLKSLQQIIPCMVCANEYVEIHLDQILELLLSVPGEQIFNKTIIKSRPFSHLFFSIHHLHSLHLNKNNTFSFNNEYNFNKLMSDLKKHSI